MATERAAKITDHVVAEMVECASEQAPTAEACREDHTVRQWTSDWTLIECACGMPRYVSVKDLTR